VKKKPRAEKASEPLPRSPALIPLLLVVATLAVYFQVRHFDFVNYDDPVYVSHNPHLRDGISLEGLRWAITSGEGANWFPVTRLSQLLDAQLFGMQSGWHHLVNLLLHILSVLLLFAFLERATRARWPSALVALLFALHPLHVESVAWVSERKDVLCAFFWMLSLWLWTRGDRRLSLAAFCLGLMSKPMIVSLPFLLPLLDVWPFRLNRTIPWKQLLLEKTPFFALSAVAAVVTYLVQQSGGAVRTFSAFPLSLRIGNALVSYVVYLGQLFWPANLAVFYPYPVDLAWWQAALAAIILAGVSAAVLRVLSDYPYLAVGWFWYLVTLAPVIGIVQVGGQARADRYMYVPMIGLAIMLAWSAADLLAARPALKPVMLTAAAAASIACAVLTWNQTGYWRDSESLFQHAVNVTERNDVAQHNLGNALLEVPGRLPDAISHLQAALSINPDSAATHTDLGNALSKLPGRLPDAIAEYRAAVRIDGDLPIPHSNLGGALSKVPGGLAEAIAESRTALRLDPDFADAHDNLGSALAKSGHLPEAVAEFESALRLEPDSADIHDHLGMAFAAMPGRIPDAISEYRQALKLKPDDQQARNNLGAVLASDPSNLPQAIAQYEDVLRRDPGSAETQYNLALALAKTPGRLPDAIAHFESALRIDPNNAEAHNNLGFALTNYPARLHEAIGHFETAVRLQPDYVDAHYNLGVALANTGRMPEAIQHLETADRLKPDRDLEQLIKKLRTAP
jgi:tetratricopeptide (TPR) repeat protein